MLLNSRTNYYIMNIIIKYLIYLYDMSDDVLCITKIKQHNIIYYYYINI